MGTRETASAVLRGRAFRPFRIALKVIAGVVGLLGVLLVTLTLLLQIPQVRRVVVVQVNDQLRDVVRGRIVIQRLDYLDLAGASGLDAVVLDPEGRRIAFVRDVDARWNLFGTFGSLLGGGPIVITVPAIRITDVELHLTQDPRGELNLLRALEPRDTSPPDPTSRKVDLDLSRIVLDKARAKVQLHGSHPWRVEINNAVTSVRVAPAYTRVEPHSISFVVDDLLKKPLRARMSAAIFLPKHPNRDTTPEEIAGKLRVAAEVNGLRAFADAALSRGRVRLHLNVPETPAERLRWALDSVSFDQTVSASLNAHGPLTKIASSLQLKAGPGRLNVDGNLWVRPELGGQLRFVADDIDIRTLSRTAPMTNLGMRGQLSAHATSDDFQGRFEMTTDVGRIVDERVPAIFTQGRFTSRHLKGKAHVAEPGAPTDVDFEVYADASSSPRLLKFKTKTIASDLRRIRRPGLGLAGQITLLTNGEFDLDSEKLDTQVHADLDKVTYDDGEIRLGHVVLAARVHGPTRGPHIDAHVNGSAIRVMRYTFPTLAATAAGTPSRLLLSVKAVGTSQTPSFEVHTRFERADAIVFRNTNAELRRPNVALTAHVDTIRMGESSFRIENASIQGLGSPITASVEQQGNYRAVRVHAPNTQLSRIASLLDIRDKLKGGRLALDIDASSRGNIANGHAHVTLEHATFLPFEDVRANINASLTPGNLSVTAALSTRTIGWVRVMADGIRFQGPALSSSVMRRSTGRVDVDGSVDLSRASQLLPLGFPISHADGSATFSGSVARLDSGRPVDARLSVRTARLKLIGNQDVVSTDSEPPRTQSVPSWESTGVDVELSSRLDGSTGALTVSTVLFDERGPLFVADARTNLGTQDLTKHLPTREELLRAPFQLSGTIPKRSLQSFPMLLQPAELGGEIQATLIASGTASSLRAELTLNGHALHARHTLFRNPFETSLHATYGEGQAEVELGVQNGRRRVLHLHVTATLPTVDQLLESRSVPPWHASGAVQFSNFPLHGISTRINATHRGWLNGHLRLDGLHQDGRLDGELTARNLQVGPVLFPYAASRLKAGADVLQTSVVLRQTAGSAELNARAPLVWGKELIPKIRQDGALEAVYRLRGLQLAALQPLLDETFHRFDGHLSGYGRIRLRPELKLSTAQGNLLLKDGTFGVTALGSELHDVQASVRMHPNGYVSMPYFSARVQTGRIVAKASAKLSGLQFETAKTWIRVAEGEKIPVGYQGLPLGDAWGAVDLKIDADPEDPELKLYVTIPSFRLELPPTTPRSLQSLDEPSEIRIGLREGDGRYQPLLLEKPEDMEESGSVVPIRVWVTLGNHVWITREQSTRVAIAGQVQMRLADEMQMTGRLRVPRGVAEVIGKRFEIDRAIVTFEDDQEPSNPTVVATAFWDAPDGTRVFADFVGPVETGKLTLRSDPPHTQGEILALLLTGSADGGVGASSGGGSTAGAAASAGAGVGGALLTQGLNEALSDLTDLNVSTRIGTSPSNNPRPELAVQVTDDITAQVAYNVSLPPPGQNPDRTMLMLDWRFLPKWSLLTTVGDRGTSILDILWQHRY